MNAGRPLLLRQPFGPEAFDEVIVGAAMPSADEANIGRVVYGASEEALLALTGSHEENPTLSLPCREVLARGQKSIEVIGPVPSLEAEMLEPHQGFWASR